MATARQIAANRRNALNSTGPRTDEGKAASRRNALVHGLAGRGVVVPEDEAEAVARRRAEWRMDYALEGASDEWWYEQLVVASVRIDRCQHELRVVRAELAERAATSWDLDRRLAVEDIAERLVRRPAATVRRLLATPQGVDWLITHWRGLSITLARHGAWDDDQVELAYDLMGTPAACRDGHPCPDGVKPSEFVSEEVEALRTLRREVLEPLDERRRERTIQGIEIEAHPELTRLRRYEAAAFRLFHQARAQLVSTREHEPAAAGQRAPHGADRPIDELRREWPSLDELLADDPRPDPFPDLLPQARPRPRPLCQADANPLAPRPEPAPAPAPATSPRPAAIPPAVSSNEPASFVAASPTPGRSPVRPIPTADTPPVGPSRSNPIVVPPAVVAAPPRPLAATEPPRLNRRQRRAALRAARGGA